MTVLDRVLKRRLARPAAPVPAEVAPAPEEVPASLFLFGPTHSLHVGMRLDYTGDPRPWGMRMLGERPSIMLNRSGGGSSPADQRIWRLTPDDPSTVRAVPRAGFWTCRSATIVEELSPATVASAWGDLIRFCRRLASMTHDEAIRIAPLLGAAGTLWPRPDTAFGRWAEWAVVSAALAAHTDEHPTMHVYRAGGGTYEDIIDPSWLTVEAAALRLADGLSTGAAILAQDGAAFGPWGTSEQ
jgi:hypothetical protein